MSQRSINFRRPALNFQHPATIRTTAIFRPAARPGRRGLRFLLRPPRSRDQTNLLELIASPDASIVDDETVIDGAKAVLDKLQARKRAAENRIELKRRLLAHTLQQIGLKTLRTPTATLTLAEASLEPAGPRLRLPQARPEKAASLARNLDRGFPRHHRPHGQLLPR